MNPRLSNLTDYKKAKTFSHAGKVIAEHPLSPGQRALWFLQQLAPKSNAYSIYRAEQVPFELDIDAVQRTFQKLADRHAILRTTFTIHNGEPVQQIHDFMDLHFQVEDVSSCSIEAIRTRLNEEALRPFNLEQGPLLRLYLFKRSLNDFIVLLNVHHIASDLWSLAVFLTEMGIIYDAITSSTVPDLPPLEIDYTDYVNDQLNMLNSPVGEQHWQYWQNQLAGELPVLNLPADRPRPPVQTHRGRSQAIRLSTELANQLKILGRSHKTTLFTTLLAAYQVLLHRYTGQEDIIVGTPKAGRNRKTMSVLGYFVNPLPIRINISGDQTFSEVLNNVSLTTKEAFEHEDYPFAQIVEQLQPVRDTSRSPIFQTMFTWQKTTRLVNSEGFALFAIGEPGGRMNFGSLPLISMSVEDRIAQFDLTLLMALTTTDLAASIEYNADLFDDDTIRRMLGHLKNLLEGIVDNPEQQISKIPLLSKSEQQRLEVEQNNTQRDFSRDHCIQQLFEVMASRTPEAVAVVSSNTKLTFGKLNQYANQLAYYLQSRGIGPDTIVGLCVDRSPEAVIGILGILKAGGAFMPIDPSYPHQRLEFMLTDSNVSLILTQKKLENELPKFSGSLVFIDEKIETVIQKDCDNLSCTSHPESLAYVIYTSGSTGRPKGVMLTHRGLCNLVNAQIKIFSVRPDSKVLQYASLSFDASVSEIFMALISGASLHFINQEDLLSSSALIQSLQQQAITTLTLPPSMLKILPDTDLPKLETIISAGENCTIDIADKWKETHRFINAYGPTESTVCTTSYHVNSTEKLSKNIPIGLPIDNIQVYILDEHMSLVPIGVPGELYIGGVGLARGYLNRPDLTAEKFIPNPFAKKGGERLYRSGDLARYIKDGNVEFLGRHDHQVKVRGFRVELGEIETLLKLHESVRDVVVLAKNDKAGDTHLVAYIITNGRPLPDNIELKEFLEDKVPEYIVPTTFVQMESIPTTHSGKIDQKSFPDPNFVNQGLKSSFVPPNNDTEKKLSQVWGEVLEVDRVGIHDNFFDLGGHSLKMIKLHSKLEELFERELSVIEMFKYPTIQTMSKFLNKDQKKQSLFNNTEERITQQKARLSAQRKRIKYRRG